MNRISLIQSNKDKQISFAERPNVTFILKKEIGRGASCIVYYAEGSDGTEHLLKEYYPKHLDLTRDSSGRVVVPADKAYAYEQGLIRFQEGYSKQRELRRHDELRNRTCNIEGIYGNNGTEYVDMTYFTGKCYAEPDVKEPSVYTLMLRMRALAEVIGAYHKRGYLHLDVKPQNIFALPESEKMVLLFDFDSVVPLKSVSESKVLSCSREWAAPEQLLPEKRRTICPATDLFAIGEIIFVQLFGRHSTNAERRSFVTGYPYDHKADIFKDMNPKVFPLLDELLCHTICGVAKQRYQCAETLIGQIENIINVFELKEPFIISNCVMENTLAGDISKSMDAIHKKLVCCGEFFKRTKTPHGSNEFIKKYIRTYQHEYDAILLLDCSKGMKSMVNNIQIANFASKNNPGSKPGYEQVFDVLDQLCDERVLLIINNFHEGFLVDDAWFDLQEIIRICIRLSTLHATILTCGSFDKSKFQVIHWQFFYNLLKKLAEHHLESTDYDSAKAYVQKAKKAARHCDDASRLKLDCERLLGKIRAEEWMNVGLGLDEEEMILDEHLFQFRHTLHGYGQE